MQRNAPAPLRLSELIAALSLASDLGLGHPMEYLIHSCLLALRLGERMGLEPARLHEVYHLALLRWIGCTGHAEEVSELFPDEIAARGRLARLDQADPRVMLGQVLRHGGEGLPLGARLRTLMAAARSSPKEVLQFQYRASCEVGQLFAARLGYGDGLRGALWHAFERWDGRGFPNGVRGDQISLAMRVVHVAQDAEVFHRSGGVEAAVAVAQQRAGQIYDPAIAALFCDEAEALFAGVAGGSAWEAAIAAEPPPCRVLSEEELDPIFEVIADYVDLKAPSLTGHSRGVAALASAAAQAMGLAPSDIEALRRAALVHDLGRCGVPNSIWEKAGRLSESEWERVRLHPYLTGRILARCDALARYANIASSHHERMDGSGFHRGIGGSALPVQARILAAADAYHAMTEPRAYRAPLDATAAAAALRAEVRAGRMDGEAAEAVLTAAGQRPRRRRERPDRLTAREVEVLRLLCRGLTTRALAQRLVISERTAAHHVESIYAKIGVSTRGAAALYAMQHDLVDTSVADEG